MNFVKFEVVIVLVAGLLFGVWAIVDIFDTKLNIDVAKTFAGGGKGTLSLCKRIGHNQYVVKVGTDVFVVEKVYIRK